jgi:hypothetical protein
MHAIRLFRHTVSTMPQLPRRTPRSLQDNLTTDLSHAMWDRMWDWLTSSSENSSKLLR